VTPGLWLLVGSVAWLAVAAPIAAVIGKAIEQSCAPAVDAPDVLDAWLDDIPVDCLSQAEIDRRAARLDVWL